MNNSTQYTSSKTEYAEVTSVNHPLVEAKGFTNINPGEMVLFEDNSLGQVLSYDSEVIKLMVFTKKPIRTGSRLYRTEKQLSFPLNSQLLGAVYNPLGDLLISTPKSGSASQQQSILQQHNEKQAETANNPEITQKNQQTQETEATQPQPQTKSSAVEYREIYQQPEKIVNRRRVTNQLMTGFSITDLLLPIGEGQRELLIGDRKSGKGVFARNLAVKQANLGNKVVYAMIAKKTEDIKNIYDFFLEQGVIDSITIIASTPKDSISSIVITPYTAMTVAEYLLSHGDNVLLILDDLTSQAEFYREISLLAKKFPGRDSYPGDIFFTQAQLLERSGAFVHPTDPNKTVALTCLPVVRTTNSDLTDFIASNLISITDGHLLFEPRLFNQGYRPAINVGLSVTRVGKQTQSSLQRDINLNITRFLTTYYKTKNLTHLGSEISEQSQKVLQKGDLLTDFFSESNNIPHHVQIILLAMIWLDWFENTHKNVIASCKFELTKHHSKDDVKQKIDELIDGSQSFKDLLQLMEQEKSFLLGLCQV